MSGETDEIVFEESDSNYRDAESNEVALGTALRDFECPECGVSPTWVLDPDPDSLRYYSDYPCDCDYNYYIKPTKVKIDRVEAGV